MEKGYAAYQFDAVVADWLIGAALHGAAHAHSLLLMPLLIVIFVDAVIIIFAAMMISDTLRC